MDPEVPFVRGGCIEREHPFVGVELELKRPPFMDCHLVFKGVLLHLNADDIPVLEQLVLAVRVVGLMDPHLSSGVVEHEVSLVVRGLLEKLHSLCVFLEESLD